MQCFPKKSPKNSVEDRVHEMLVTSEMLKYFEITTSFRTWKIKVEDKHIGKFKLAEADLSAGNDVREHFYPLPKT